MICIPVTEAKLTVGQRKEGIGLVPTSILVAGGSLMETEVLRAALEHRKNFDVVGSASSAKELLKQATERQPNVAVICSKLQGDPDGGLKVLRKLRVAAPTTRPIVLLDCSDSERVIGAFSSGAKGVVCQTDPFESLCKCIRSVRAGQIWTSSEQITWVVKTMGDREPIRVVSVKGIPLLTRREVQVVSMVVEGLPNREIAGKLGVSAHTVKNHLFRIYEKLGISNRAELILYTLSSKAGSPKSSPKTQPNV